jgi:hypothetical protein
LPTPKNDATGRLYSLIANEEDARVCTDIPDEACREVPRNFFLILGSNVLTKLGDLLVSPKTVLAWLLSAIGAPALVAWLVPIRESGSMIPQMIIGAWVRQKPVRKWFWTLGSFGQAISVLDMAGGNKRTDYTAVSNTVIGILLLLTGGLTALVSMISDVAVILLLGLMGLAGAISATRLTEVTAD